MVKTLLHLEGAAVFAASLYALFFVLHVSWWWLPVVLLGPDISMVGYLANPRTGSMLYNAAHTLVLAIPVLIVGLMLEQSAVTAAGLILVGHIGMDRMFGYGLKYASAFKDTHFGRV